MWLRWRPRRTPWRSPGSSSRTSRGGAGRPEVGKRITGLRAKTDKIDAALLARLLAAGFLAEVWTPDEPTRVRRRLISRRMHLVRQRVREKNQVHAVLQRQLKSRPPMTDVFGVKGRIWLSDQCRLLPTDEQQTVDACLRQIDFLAAEIELVDIEIAKQVLASEDIRRLMTLPGSAVSPRPRCWPRSVMSAGSRPPTTSSAISG